MKLLSFVTRFSFENVENNRFSVVVSVIRCELDLVVQLGKFPRVFKG